MCLCSSQPETFINAENNFVMENPFHQGKPFQFSVGMTGKSVEQTKKLEPCQIRNEPVLTVSGGLLQRDLSSQELRDIAFNFH